MNKLTPYLMFNGNCKEALEFYTDCFKGEILFMGKFIDSPMEVSKEDEDKIMHADFSFWGGKLFASDHINMAGFTSFSTESNIHMSLSFDQLDEMKSTFESLSHEGTITMPINETFWGDTFGMLTDKFGIKWMMSFREEKPA